MLKHLLNCVISTDNSNDENNRLILSESGEDYEQYFYDNAGNLTKKATQYTTEYYSYDGYNRLNAYYNGQTNAEYSYNVAGLRKSKTVNGNTTRFVYDGADVVGELTNSNYYIYYRGTELIGYKAYTGESYYYRQNAHGDVTAILDVFGNEVKNYSYDAFGEKKAFITPPAGENTILYQWKAETEAIHNPFGYCGEYTDTETGLVYLRNRMYSPSIGRFTTEDPIKDGLNWYAYCENNPIMFFDPSGSETEQDKEVYGENSAVYKALVLLGRAWQAFPGYRKDIESLANEIRYLGNTNGADQIDKWINNGMTFAKIKIPENLNMVEKVLVVCYRAEALKINSAREEADKKTQEIFYQPGNGDDDANAFKHAYWNAIATYKAGASVAKLFSDAHEFGWVDENINNPTPMIMDLHNNQIGIYVGNAYRNSNTTKVLNQVLGELYTGNLWYISGGNLMPTRDNLILRGV